MNGALGLPSPTHGLAELLARARRWPVESQQQARRNAMLAATDATRRRVEREDVADYLAGLARTRDEDAGRADVRDARV